MSSTTSIKFKYESIHNPQAWHFLEAWRQGGEAELTRMDATEGWYHEATTASGIFGVGKFGLGNEDALFVADEDRVSGDAPTGKLELSYGPFASYNWEALFHVPMFLAIRNKESGDYSSALYWLQMVFDPRQPESDEARRWRFAPLRGQSVDTTPDDEAQKAQFSALLATWRRDPYNPWLIARARPSALRRWVVSNYLECLVRWGDELFEQDTMESINEAAALYLIAHRVVGPEPTQPSDVASATSASTPASLFAGNFYVDAEDVLDHGQVLRVQRNEVQQTPELASWSVGFCVPDNPMADTWRKTIADRLFKIRNSLDIRGVRRELPFFAPPIDPALLVRARAEGLSIHQVLNRSSNPAGFRAQTLLSLAMEFTQDVRGLGSAILSALEKRDAEHLSRLRQNHEQVILTASRVQRERAVEEANIQRSVLQERLETTRARIEYLKVLLSPGSGFGGADQEEGIAPDEAAEQSSIAEAEEEEQRAGKMANEAARWAALPSVNLTIEWGLPPKAGVSTGVGTQLITASYQYFAQRRERAAARHRAASARAAMRARNARRSQEWKHSLDQAEREARVIERELLGAELRIQSMAFEAEQLERQIDHNAEITDYLTKKFTSEDLYIWMVEQLTQLHDTAMTLALSMARRAADALKTELLPDDSTDTLSFRVSREKRGLLAGDTLLQDLRKLQEFRVLRAPASELESTTRFSLREWDPVRFLQLRHDAPGSVSFDVPKIVFDANYPDQWKRRIRSVALTIPAVVASSAGVHATLRLTGSQMEDATGILAGGTPPSRNEIVTSTGVEDIGFADEPSQSERYRPFELAGAVSTWTLSLPPKTNRMDRQSIEDAVLQIRHVARTNSTPSGTSAYEAWRKTGGGAGAGAAFPTMPTHLMDVPAQYPDQWKAWVANGGTLALPVRQDQLEHLRNGETVRLRWLAACIEGPTTSETWSAAGPWADEASVSPPALAIGSLESYTMNYSAASSPQSNGDLQITTPWDGSAASSNRAAITSFYLLLGYVAD